MRLARAAVRLGQDIALVLSYAAFAFAHVIHDLQLAKALVDQALELNLNFAAAWASSGWINLYLGDPGLALEHLRRAHRLSPLDVLGTPILTGMAHANFFLDRHDESLSWAVKSLQGRPDAHPALGIAAASAIFAGRDDVAQQMVARLRTSHSRLPRLQPEEHSGPLPAARVPGQVRRGAAQGRPAGVRRDRGGPVCLGCRPPDCLLQYSRTREEHAWPVSSDDWRRSSLPTLFRYSHLMGRDESWTWAHAR